MEFRKPHIIEIPDGNDFLDLWKYQTKLRRCRLATSDQYIYHTDWLSKYPSLLYGFGFKAAFAKSQQQINPLLQEWGQP